MQAETTDNPFFVEEFDGGDLKFRDYKNTSSAINFLNDFDGAVSQNFFLGVGIYKPHTDWVVPKEYFDLYPLSEIKLPTFIEDDLSDVPVFMKDLVNNFHDQVLAADKWAEIVQGYLASVSFADAMIGRVLDALKDNGLEDDTTIVLWSDHGYHLGDKEKWHKFTLWEEAARAPLIIVDPEVGEAGQKVDQVVELLDIFPTVLDLAGVAPASWAEGDSLVSLMKDVDAPWENVAVTQMYGSFSVRTDGHRYIRYEDGSEELYDIIGDPHQWNNLAQETSYAQVKAELKAELLDYAQENAVFFSDDNTDLVIGSAGNDMLVGGHPGTLSGGTGNDSYIVSDPNVTIVEPKEGGIDTVFTNMSFVLPEGVENLGTRSFRPTPLTLVGNDLNNAIWAKWKPDEINGRGGNDTLDGGAGNDVISGGTGSDSLIGFTGDDTLGGDSGDDTLTGGSGKDAFVGTPDELDGDVITDFTANDFIEIRGVRFASSAISISGGSTILNIDTDGEDGVDTVITLDGTFEDVFEATSSDEGEPAYTRIRLDSASPPEPPSGATPGNDLLNGTAGDDFLKGLGGNDTINGDQGDDTLRGSGDDDVVNGGEGNDRLWGNWGNDTLRGNGGDDVVNGGEGDDRQWGNWGDDTLDGGTGDDTLKGGQNNDTLIGGEGDDALSGGSGDDRFAFSGINGTDTITDFAIGSNVIEISGYGVVLQTFGDLDIDDDGTDTTIDLDTSVAGAGMIVVAGVIGLDATDFDFT